jgi:hypothetical protein
MGNEMADVEPRPAAQAMVAGCPWCGDGTQLTLKGDGFGEVSLSCLKCHCRGPAVTIEGDFDQADAQAIASWSSRSGIDLEVLERVKSAVDLAAVLNGGKATASTEVPVRFGDLVKIIRTSRPGWLRKA